MISAWLVLGALVSQSAINVGLMIVRHDDAPAIVAEHGHDSPEAVDDSDHHCMHCVPACFEGHGHQCMGEDSGAVSAGLLSFAPLCAGDADRQERAFPDHPMGKFLTIQAIVPVAVPPPAPTDIPTNFLSDHRVSPETPPPKA